MPRQLRIVYLSHVARFSGAEIEMLRLIEAADGVESLVVLAEDGPLVPALLDAGARVDVMGLAERARGLSRGEVRLGLEQASAAFDVIRYIARLRARIGELRPDAVSAISLKAGVYGSLAARLAGVPLVWHLHDQIASSYLSRQAVLPMRAIIATLPSAVVSPSRVTLGSVGRFRPGMRTAVIPHPVPIPAAPVAIRPEVERVGIVGRLAPWKGQDVFLEAFAQAFPRPGARAVLVGAATFGEEGYERELRELASRLGISERVDFRGFRQDVQAELEMLDLLVHASVLTEPGGTAIFEGMAKGLPVIATAGSGPAEYVEHGREALLHTPGDVGGLAAMMRLAAGDPRLRAALGAAGRERAQAFAPEAIARRWRDLYERLAGEPSGGP